MKTGVSMANKSKKMAAALAAVNVYLQQEQAAQQEMAAVEEKAAPAVQVSMWGHSGRQEMMAMRRLIQMRTFTRF